MRIAWLVLLILPLAGCEGRRANRANAANAGFLAKYQAAHPIRRFAVIPGDGARIALDTQTGQICRTWNWNLRKASQPVNGEVPSVEPGDLAPTCLSLYMGDPTNLAPSQ